jgi:hypothetical protein
MKLTRICQNFNPQKNLCEENSSIWLIAKAPKQFIIFRDIGKLVEKFDK